MSPRRRTRHDGVRAVSACAGTARTIVYVTSAPIHIAMMRRSATVDPCVRPDIPACPPPIACEIVSPRWSRSCSE